MTYKELLSELQQLDKDRLADTVTVFDPYMIEFIPIDSTKIADKEDTDVLIEGHLYLVMQA
jgi:hypothetical protein